MQQVRLSPANIATKFAQLKRLRSYNRNKECKSNYSELLCIRWAKISVTLLHARPCS